MSGESSIKDERKRIIAVLHKVMTNCRHTYVNRDTVTSIPLSLFDEHLKHPAPDSTADNNTMDCEFQIGGECFKLFRQVSRDRLWLPSTAGPYSS